MITRVDKGESKDFFTDFYFMRLWTRLGFLLLVDVIPSVSVFLLLGIFISF